MIIALVEGDPALAAESVARLHEVTGAEVHGGEVTITAADGAAAIAAVAVALNGSGVKVKELTLRRPSLDDVFLELTGGRIEEAEDHDA